MKSVYVLLIGVVLFAFGAIALAEDPYSGTYTCSGDPKQGCGTCADFGITPPDAMIVTKAGNAYKFCPQYSDSSRLRDDECTTREIQNGKAHWAQKETEDGLTIDAVATATFANSTLTLEESGTISGECNCNFALKAICTK